MTRWKRGGNPTNWVCYLRLSTQMCCGSHVSQPSLGFTQTPRSEENHLSQELGSPKPSGRRWRLPRCASDSMELERRKVLFSFWIIFSVYPVGPLVRKIHENTCCEKKGKIVIVGAVQSPVSVGSSNSPCTPQPSSKEQFSTASNHHLGSHISSQTLGDGQLVGPQKEGGSWQSKQQQSPEEGLQTVSSGWRGGTRLIPTLSLYLKVLYFSHGRNVQQLSCFCCATVGNCSLLNASHC